MQKELELVKFNLTQDMSNELINFNNLKKELFELKRVYDIEKKQELLIQIENIKEKLNTSRDKFIESFRLNNKEEIEEYLSIKSLNLLTFFHTLKGF